MIGYCRVSTPVQKDDSNTQVENGKRYRYAKGYPFEIMEDIGSGINYIKNGLKKLLSQIKNHEISKVVILSKDRLVRFGYERMESLCQRNGVKREMIHNTEYSKEQERTDDLIPIIPVFANKLYGQR